MTAPVTHLPAPEPARTPPPLAAAAPELDPLRWLQSSSIDQVATALADAQGSFEAVKKDTENTFFKSKYATLAGVLDAARPALAANGLAIVQQPMPPLPGSPDHTVMTLWTRVVHKSGQWLGSLYDVRPIVKERETVKYPEDPQAVGSALTYARRYAALASLGLAPEDDDGNAASRSSSGGQQSNGGQARRERPQQPPPADDAAADRYAKRIEDAADLTTLTGLGTAIAADQTLTPNQKQGLHTLYVSRGRELSPKPGGAADTTTEPPAAAAEQPPATPAGGPVRVGQRPSNAPDNARRQRAEQAAREQHPTSLRGAALATGLLLESRADVAKLTAVELEKMADVTGDAAEEAEIAWAAEQEGQ